MLAFFVPGKPAPQGSKRHVGRGILIESSREVGPWRERVALSARSAMARRPLMDGGLALDLMFVMPRPASTPKSRTPLAVKRPDIDKLARAALDALTHVVFADDSQVVELAAHKRLAGPSESPGVWITAALWVAPEQCPCGCRYLDQSGWPGPICPHCDPIAAERAHSGSEPPWRPGGTGSSPKVRERGAQP